MTPKEKAKQLVEKFKLEPIKPLCIMHPQHSKKCALIAVDYLIKEAETIEAFNYWEQVAEQIQIL